MPGSADLSAELQSKALEAQWEVPAGRIGGVIRQLRHRADVAGRRANQFFWALNFVVIAGILYYLLLPIIQSLADGGRQAQEDTLAYNETQLAELDRQRNDLRNSLVERFALAARALDLPENQVPISIEKNDDGDLLTISRSGDIFQLSESLGWTDRFTSLDAANVTSATPLGDKIVALVGSPNIGGSLSPLSIQAAIRAGEDVSTPIHLVQLDSEIAEIEKLQFPAGARFTGLARASRVVILPYRDKALIRTTFGGGPLRLLRLGQSGLESLTDYTNATPIGPGRFVSRKRVRQQGAGELSSIYQLTELDIRGTEPVFRELPLLRLPRPEAEDGRPELIARTLKISDQRLIALSNQGSVFSLEPGAEDWSTLGKVIEKAALTDDDAQSRTAVRSLIETGTAEARKFFAAGPAGVFASDDLRLWEQELEAEVTTPRVFVDSVGTVFAQNGNLLRRYDSALQEFVTDLGEGVPTSGSVSTRDGFTIVNSASTMYVSDDFKKGWSEIIVPTPGPDRISSLYRRDDGKFEMVADRQFFVVDDLFAKSLAAIAFPTSPNTSFDGDDALLSFLDSEEMAPYRNHPTVLSIINSLKTIRDQRQYLIDARTRAEGLLEFYNSLGSGERSAVRDFVPFLRVCREQSLADSNGASQPTDGEFVQGCLTAYEKLTGQNEAPWLNTLLERAPQAILLLFLLATLGGLYRYNLRLFGFHHSRADILELTALKGSKSRSGLTKTDVVNIQMLADALSADKVEFARANTPTEQAVSLARAIANRPQ